MEVEVCTNQSCWGGVGNLELGPPHEEGQGEEEGVAEIFIISIRPSTATSLKLADFIHWSS